MLKKNCIELILLVFFSLLREIVKLMTFFLLVVFLQKMMHYGIPSAKWEFAHRFYHVVLMNEKLILLIMYYS